MLISRLAYYLSSIPTLVIGVENWWLLGLLVLRLRGRDEPVLRLRPERGSPKTSAPNARGIPLRLRVRTAMDVWVIKEVCLDRDYEGGVPLQDGWTLLDVGAGIGDFSISVAKRFPLSRVIALEPFPPSYRLLLENMRLNNATNVEALAYALGAGSGPQRLRAGRAEPGQSSTVRHGAGVTAAEEEVPGRSLSALFEELGITRCDFLKMDCEGAEYEILMTADQGTLARVRHVALEYHDRYTRHSHKELAEFLRAQGFLVRTKPSRAHREIGYLFATRDRPA
jgi:FkbM family methyltransferase